MIEKQFDRIARWLSRSRNAYRRGEYAEAAAEVQCAQAELQITNAELLRCCYSSQKGKGRSFSKALLAAAASVPLLAAPLAVSVQRPSLSAAGNFTTENLAAAERADGDLQLEWVTYDEKALLASIRRSLSDANVTVPSSVAEEIKQGGPRDVKKQPSQSPQLRQSHRVAAAPPRNEVSDDEMFRLVEVGRRALQSAPSSIILDHR